MTMVCAYCRAAMGEKCPECGSISTYNFTPDRFICHPCGKAFDRSQGGTSHGICPDCYSKLKAEIHAA